MKAKGKTYLDKKKGRRKDSARLSQMDASDVTENHIQDERSAKLIDDTSMELGSRANKLIFYTLSFKVAASERSVPELIRALK